ncbi:MAG: right-handed parallel beta-helix repeat-containing protein [Candidatus Paceibacterota bacterium]|jgi:pimeloyl-ACP methyl ester carboxylesterase
MRVVYAALFSLSASLVWGVPNTVFAATDVASDINTDTHWMLDGSPYRVQSKIIIDGNATLSIDPGVIVQFDIDSSISVLGRLFAQGSPDEPISFISVTGSEWNGIEFSNPEDTSSLDNVVIQYAYTAITDFYSKDLSVSNTRVEDSRYGIDAYGSNLLLANFSAENLSGDAITISHGSDVILKNVTLNNIDEGIDVSVDSNADISNLSIDHSRGETIVIYVESSVQIASSTITNSQNDAIAVFNSSSLTARNMRVTNGTKDGAWVYGGSSIDIQESVISGFSNGTGICDYGGREGDPTNSLSVINNEITNNDTGVGLYENSFSHVISNNSIYDNTSYGLMSFRTQSIDVSNNFWGDSSGPYHDLRNLMGKGNAMYDWNNTVIFSPWLSFWGTSPSSNVLFLPGIEGSRLYEGTGCGKGAEEKLWEPIGESLWKILRGAGDEKVRELFLNDTGESICDDIYTKEGDILDSAGGDIYKSFISEINGLKTDGIIADWKPIAYDWRLSLDDLLNNGAERDGKIYYSEAASTPYLEQTLRTLASSSKTGKVTIVAHSNGGLVAKALLNQLGGETPQLVDRVIMVGAPQSGAPVDVGALLYGYDQGISSWGIPILHSDVARSLALNSPMAYHLLPSENYLESVASDMNHFVVRFAGDAYAKEISDYGATITNNTDLTDFLRVSELNSSLIDYANVQHSVLDIWAPPDGVEVDQIAGWGADTVAGIDFYTQQSTDAITALEPIRAYRPIFTEDGDGTVPVPSALMMASSTSVKRYWVNLFSYNNETNSNRKHKDLFEIPSLQDFIKNIITNSTSSLPSYISTSQPPVNTENKKLTFFLHSPLTLQLTDPSGNITGLAEDDSMTQDIPDSTYGEFGEVKYITVPEGSYQLTMHGQASGTFSLDIQETTGGTVTNSSTIANVPTTASTLASLTISGGIDTVSALSVDENGDGKSIITITPKAGETVNYVPSVPTPVSASKRSGSSGTRNTRIPVTTTDSVTSTSSPQAIAPKVVVFSEKIVKVENLPTSASVTSPEDASVNIPQTASVYDASQQLMIKKIVDWVYTVLYGLWSLLKKLF